MLDKKTILRLFHLLNDALHKQSISGELYLVGGAVMCLCFQARAATKDVDSIFAPAAAIRQAAQQVAAQTGIPSDWLNDGVKAFLSDKSEFVPYLDLSHLKIFTASAPYLLAMKCLAMRLSKEFQDVSDVRFLLRNLNITTYEQACAVIAKYYPLASYPQKTLYALEELLADASPSTP